MGCVKDRHISWKLKIWNSVGEWGLFSNRDINGGIFQIGRGVDIALKLWLSFSKIDCLMDLNIICG